MTTPTIPFGKFRGQPLDALDHNYLRWMVTKAKSRDAWAGLVRFVDSYREDIEAILDPRARVAAIEVDYTLSESQAAAVKQIEAELLMDADTSCYRLEGGAGYGKSFAVLDLVRTAMHHGYEVHACAVSYVATQVLCSHLERYGIEPKTIASKIRLAKVELEDREDYETTPDTHDALREILSTGNLLIVDEYSMVGDEHADMMMQAAHQFGGKLLAVGDLKQLPPVKQHQDSSFSQIPGSVTLTQPMRYAADSDLYALEQLARHNPRNLLSRDWNGSTLVNVHETFSALLQAYITDYKADPAADARMLFFRRADVIEANATVRRALFGEQASTTPVIEDEALMVTATTDIRTGRTVINSRGDREEEKIRFYSGTSFLVESVREDVVDGIPCYVVRFQDGTVDVPVLFGMGSVLDQDSRGAQEFQARLSELREDALESKDWREWRRFKNTFLPVCHRYASTVHRAQGATLDRVYFDPSKLTGSSMSDKLLYVAATRAKKEAHIVAGGSS